MVAIELFKYNQFYSTIDNYSIQNFTIYGERHSGTNWVEKLIKDVFHIPITWDYGHKHFFGCSQWSNLNTAHNTLFIGIVRNIYNWIGGMKKTPYHLDTSNILDIKPWQSARGLSDYHKFCDSHWYTKEKYQDIFDMRSNKLQFLYLYMPYLVDNYIFIRYEDLIEYTEAILDIISDMYKIRKISNRYNSDRSKIHLYKLSNHYINEINNSTQWKTENMVGYQQIWDKSQPYRFD